MADAKTNFVGRSVTRLEDRPLLLGQGRFAADVAFAGQLYMRLVRSAHANAKLKSIDCAAARSTPGVHAVWTADDVADIPPIDFRLSKIFRFGPTTSTVFWEMFNVFNVDNWQRYQGSLQSAQFGLPLTEGPKRRQQIGFRFEF